MKSDDDTECAASTWAENFKKQHETDDKLNLDNAYQMATFWTSMDEAFADANEKKLSEIWLQQFSQGKLSFQEYIQQFEILARLAGYVLVGAGAQDGQLINLLERQVHKYIVERMYMTSEEAPTTYAAYKKKLAQIANNAEKQKAIAAGQSYNANQGNRTAPVQQQQGQNRGGGSSRSSPGVTPGSGAPMDVDRSKHKHSGLQCYNCQEYGHIAANCPEPKKEPPPRKAKFNSRIRAILKDIKEEKPVDLKMLRDAIKEEGF